MRVANVGPRVEFGHGAGKADPAALDDVSPVADQLCIIVSEQNLHFAKLISDRAYIIERGRICFGGTMAELDARPDIRDAHLSL